MKSTRKCRKQLSKLNISYGPLEMVYCSNPQGIEQYFSREVNLISFPPDGVVRTTELDVFYTIKLGDSIVGYYKAVDLFFDGIIELHGSYDGPRTFLLKTYFLLTKKFVSVVQNTFPDKVITVLIDKSNTKVLKLLYWLKFEKDNDYIDSKYASFRLNNPEMLIGIRRMVHWWFRR